MGEYFNHHDSIEGEKLSVFSRKILKNKSLIQYTKLGLCIKYKCDRNSSAEIREELKDEDKVKECRVREDSHICLNDKLKCDAMFVIHVGKKSIKITNYEGVTGRHGGQFMDTNSRSYAEITYPFEHIAKVLLKKKKELNVSKEKPLLMTTASDLPLFPINT